MTDNKLSIGFGTGITTMSQLQEATREEKIRREGCKNLKHVR